MRKVRKQLLVFGVGALGLVLATTGGAYAAFGPGETFGFVWTEYGAAESQDSVDLVAQQGKSLVTQRYFIPPGFDGLWPTHPGHNVVMHIRGSALRVYENCGNEERVWEATKSYYRDGSMSPHGMRVVNTESATAELVVVWLDVNPDDGQNTLPWGDPELVRGACVAPSEFNHYEYGRGPAHTDIPWSHEAGTMVVAMHFLVAPQWHFNWHTHPPTFITHLRGSMREYIGCPEIIDWEPNVTYLHSPLAFGRPQERAKNLDSHEASEFWVMFSRADSTRVRGQIPVTFTPPPEECPTDGFTTNTD